MAGVKCSNCGSEMVLRVARRGRNVGGQFYGCSRYPSCKATLPFESDISNATPRDEVPRSHTSDFQRNLPRALRARSKFQQYQVRFFESATVGSLSLKKFRGREISIEQRRAFSQWRLDYPLGVATHTLSESQQQVIAVAEKILARGRITLCSPTIEARFAQTFLDPVDERIIPASAFSDSMCFSQAARETSPVWLDSPAESSFYQDILPSILGEDFRKWTLPQVEIASLVTGGNGTSTTGRVDFLVCKPGLKPLVVEVDGKQHESHKEVDLERDDLLAASGYESIRIPVEELVLRHGQQLDILRNKLSQHRKNSEVADNSTLRHIKCVQAIKRSHQIQLSILQAIQTGMLNAKNSTSWLISTDLSTIGLFDDVESNCILKYALEDLLELLSKLGGLYKADFCQVAPGSVLNPSARNIAENIHISFSDTIRSSCPTFIVQDICVPFSIANAALPASPAIIKEPDAELLKYFLNRIFRKQDFWEGQLEALSRTLAGKDSILLLPTGGGKSIVFQLAAILLPGRAVVIDPIIALMDDQVDNLERIGIDRCIAITGQIENPEDRSRVMTLFGQGEYLFAYVTPERFQTTEFREALRALTVHTPVSVIAIDEAHCISEWGHDFRTAYLNIARTSRNFCKSNGHTPPLIALTGTASKSVLKDVQRELDVQDFDAIITPKSFNRSELSFAIVHTRSDEKKSRLAGYLGQVLPSKFGASSQSFFENRGNDSFAGLLFCPHVNGDFGVVEQAEALRKSLTIPVAVYSGKEPSFSSAESWNVAKQSIARKFKDDEISLLVCTKAYGMGIDKPNIRYTVHFGLPSSIESFYQECGRAGRDRRPAHCCILVSDDKPERTRRLLDPKTTVEDIAQAIELRNTPWDEQDDITRALFFQTKAFRGVENELADVVEITKLISNLEKSRKIVIKHTLSSVSGEDSKFRAGENRKRIEKVFHRMLVLGIVADYTINYASEEFTVHLVEVKKDSIIDCYGKYVAGYLGSRRQVEVDKAQRMFNLPLQEFVTKMLRLLLTFIYDVIEKGRRRALNEMLLAVSGQATDKSIRERILRHLETTHYSEELDKVIADPNAGLELVRDVFDSIRSPNDAAELRGQVARSLEAYPDHPGLLMLRALVELFARDKSILVAKQNFMAAIASAKDTFAIRGDRLYDFISWAVLQSSKRGISIAEELQAELLKTYPERDLARRLVERAPIELVVQPAEFLVNRMATACRKLSIT